MPLNEQITVIWHRMIANKQWIIQLINVYTYIYNFSSKISQNNQFLCLPEVKSTFGLGELREPFGSKHLTMVI